MSGGDGSRRGERHRPPTRSSRHGQLAPITWLAYSAGAGKETSRRGYVSETCEVGGACRRGCDICRGADPQPESDRFGKLTTAPALLERPDTEAAEDEPVEPLDSGLRRFVIAATAGMAIVSIPYLYVSWGMWMSGLHPLRGISPDNFYELQANALTHGHLWVPQKDLGIEAFWHGSHAYTYFGLFSSLIRLPFMVVIPAWDNHLTAPSMLAAWIVTGLVTGLLLWRVRVLARGAAPMGRAEAVASGFLMAAIMGGSVLVYLAATPWVYHEDLAWSVALTVGCIFTLLGVLERPSWYRVGWAGVFLLAANLNRLSTAWACVIGALLIAGWFALGRGGVELRRWALPVAAAGLIPLGVGCLVTWMKFGAPISVPLGSQEWTRVNLHRRQYLAANGGKGFGLQFLPSTLTAYFRPDGIHLTRLFPYVTLPTAPAAVVGNVLFDETYQTASVESAMPLLFLLAVWGVISAFRPRPIGSLRLTRLLILAAAAATVGVMLVGYIAERYVGDLLPLFILAGIIGFVDLWRRAEHWSAPVGAGLMTTVAVLAVFSIVANVGGALASVNAWSIRQARAFVVAQRSLSIGSLAASVHHGSTLPKWAPTGEIFDVGDCSGVYLSNGLDLTTIPGQQLQHENWVPLEQATGINYVVSIAVARPIDATTPAIPLFRYGPATLILQPMAQDKARIVLQHPRAAPGSRSGTDVGNAQGPAGVPESPGSQDSAQGQGKPPAGKRTAPDGSPRQPGGSGPITMRYEHTYYFQFEADPNLDQIQVRSFSPKTDSGNVSMIVQNGDSAQIFNRYLGWNGPAQVLTTNAASGSSPPFIVRDIPLSPPSMDLCHSLQKGS